MNYERMKDEAEAMRILCNKRQEIVLFYIRNSRSRDFSIFLVCVFFLSKRKGDSSNPFHYFPLTLRACAPTISRVVVVVVVVDFSNLHPELY